MTIAALRALLDERQPEVPRLPAHHPQRRPTAIPEEKPDVNAYQAVALSMHRDGYSDQQIADQIGISREEVAAIIDADQQTPAPQDRAEQPAPAPAEEIPALADLLAGAAAHEDQAVRDHAKQASTALAALRERRRVDAELQQITTEAAELEQRLAALRARESELQPQTKAGKPKRDYDPREVRTWAKKRGMTIPDRGQIPKAVLAAWRKRDQARLLQAVAPVAASK